MSSSINENDSVAHDNTEDSELIFHPDEMQLNAINESWTEEEMLENDGIFYLKDVAKKLRVYPSDFKKRAGELASKGLSPWKVMGIRKAWTHWIVRMKTFRNYYQENNFPQIKRVDPKWDGNEMLAQKGYFYLKEICEKIPFNPQQIRYQVRRKVNAKENYGVWKDPQHKSYIVDMEIFSTWIKDVWKSN